MKFPNCHHTNAGAAVGIVIASLAIVADALAYGSASYIAHPVLKAIIVILVASSCYFMSLIIRTNAINNRKSLLSPPPDLFGVDKEPDQAQRTKLD